VQVCIFIRDKSALLIVANDLAMPSFVFTTQLPGDVTRFARFVVKLG